MAEGTTTVATGTLLHTLDPTIMANGNYQLRLIAWNANNDVESDQLSFAVQSRVKLGNFNMSFTDITIPVAGIPITIGRTYDTLNANTRGDFGYGWTLTLNDAKVKVDESTLGGRGWGGEENVSGFFLGSFLVSSSRAAVRSYRRFQTETAHRRFNPCLIA